MAFTSDFILRGTRADQPTPPASPFAVVLYCVTDEGDKIERWNGTTWESYSPTGLGTVTTTGSPAAGELTQFSGAMTITNGDLSGDVTTAGSLATTIANDVVTTAKIADDAVTFAKMQNLTTDRLMGRDTAGTGNPEEVSVSGGLEFSGGPGIQRSALTGDVTASAGSNATTIANDAVTFAKMQNIATDTLIGRDTAGTGDPESISVSGGLEFSGAGGIQRSALTGDVTASAGSNTTTIANDAVTYAKIQNISAASRLLGRGSAAGSGDTEEISLGSGISMSGTTLSATGSGGSVTTTGSPASGNLAKFSGATSITNADLTGDVTTSGGVATTIANDAVTYAKIQNVTAESVLARAASTDGDLSAVTLAASKLLGRGSTGDIAAISLGSGLTMSGTTISASAGAGSAPSINDFRLTLAPGYPVFNPYPAAPSSTDTGAETVTVTNNWVSGTIATVSATGGGLTAATIYYLHVSGTTVSFHTNVADAISGSSKVNLTASITATIRPTGISNTTIYVSPWLGNSIGIYNGSTWDIITSAEFSLALGTLTSGKNYDVFVYNNSGTATIDTLVAWTDDVTRATALVRQDGIWTKSGDATRRYVGTIRTDSTTTSIDDHGGIAIRTGGKRFIYNSNNRVDRSMFVYDSSDWTYTSTTIQQANNQAGNKVEWVDGLGESIIEALVNGITSTASNDVGQILIGLNQTTLQEWGCDGAMVSIGVSVGGAGFDCSVIATLKKCGQAGYNYAAWLNNGTGSGTQAWLGQRLVGSGNNLRSGLTASIIL